MKIVLPKSILVAGVRYKIVLEKNLLDEKLIFGYCDRTLKRIVIDEGTARSSDKELLLHTFLHEVKHAQQWEYGLAQTMGQELQEIDAETTATCFLNIFQIGLRSRAKLPPRKKKRKLKK